MQLGYTFLNVWLLWSNTYSTFKTLDRRKVGAQGTRSSKMIQRNKREMKTCLSTWVAWVAWNVLEYVVDVTVGVFIPFLHEIKCLCLIFLIITRPWGTEPLVLNVIRPAIKPYLGILDTTFHWLELLGDLAWLIISMPYHMFTDWWYSSKKEVSDMEKQVDELDVPELTIGRFEFEMDDFSEPREEPEDSRQLPKPSATTLTAIEAHRKEQEQQAEEEAKLQEVQARSVRDRAAHLQRVAGGPPPPAAPAIKPIPTPIPNNAATSKAPPSVSQRQERREKPSDDLPAATLRLPRGVIPVQQINDPNRIHVPVPRQNSNINATLKPKLPIITKKPSLTTDSSSTDENTKRVLAMPVPTRPRPQRAVKPAVYSNASASIPRPPNPGPPNQVPSVVIPLATQTLPRQPRVQPIPGMQSQSQSLRTRTSQTLRTDSSTNTVRSGTSTATITPSPSEFGTINNMGTIRRGSADNYLSASRHRREMADGSGTTLDGDSFNNNTNVSGQPVRWEDFMASLERQGRTLAAPYPRGTGDDLQVDGRILNDGRRDILSATTSKSTRGWGTEERVQRITNMQKEVDEKIKRITARSDQYGSLITPETQGIYPDLNTLLASTSGRATRDAGIRPQDSDADTDIIMADTETLVSSVGQSPQSPQSPQHQPQHAGKKRPRKGSKHPTPASEGESSNSAEDAAQRSPKKRKKDLEEDVEMSAVDTPTIASTVKSKPVTRATRQKANAKDDTTATPTVPTVTRSGTTRTTRSTSQKAPEAATQTTSGVGTRTRGRRAVVS